MDVGDIVAIAAFAFLVGVFGGHCSQSDTEHQRAIDANAGYYDQTTGEFKYGCEVEHDDEEQRDAK